MFSPDNYDTAMDKADAYRRVAEMLKEASDILFEVHDPSTLEFSNMASLFECKVREHTEEADAIRKAEQEADKHGIPFYDPFTD